MFCRAEEQAMKRAIELAAAGGKRVFPNPEVGAVILSPNGETISEGFHAFCGGAHAERDALSKAGDVSGCTMVVTLEPCTHHGRTPPCTSAIIQSGINRVAVGLIDPDPRVGGKGIEHLRASGIDVETGLLEDHVRELNRVYLHHIATGRSFLHLKMAGTLDGRSAARDGSSRWITGEESRKRVHEYRRTSHAVLVGGGTAVADNPLLTARDVFCSPEDQPVRIVYSGSGLPAGLKIFNTPGRTVVAVKKKIDVPASAEVWEGIETPLQLLEKTASEGLGIVLCEGGKSLAASLLRNRLVDRFSIFAAPALLGNSGVPLIGDLEIDSISGILRLEDITVTLIGSDTLTEGKVVYRSD